MVEKLGIEENKIPDLCNLLYKNYGTTMAGLRVSPSAPFWLWIGFFWKIIDPEIYLMQAIGYDFDYDEYHRYVEKPYRAYQFNWLKYVVSYGLFY